MTAAALERKRAIVQSLCRHFSLHPDLQDIFAGKVEESDIKSLCSEISRSAKNGSSEDKFQEVSKWIGFAEGFPEGGESFRALSKLNEELVPKSVLLGDGFSPSEADVVVFSAIHSSVVDLSEGEKLKLPHLLRWVDYIQNKEDFGGSLKIISVDKRGFEPHGIKVPKEGAESVVKKTIPSVTPSDKPAVDQSDQKIEKKKKSNSEVKQEDKKPSEVELAEKDKEVSVSLLNIQVGLIRKAWKHPSADSLLVEEIDIGEAKLRQVVSGLAKYCSPEQLTNRHVVLITNVKPGKLRDVLSEGLVLCASNEDHSVVEPLLPPEGAKPGERISFAGIDGKPEDVLNPKKKQLEKITPHLVTDDKGIATFKGIPFMTSAGPCTSTIPKASIK
ncbi:hypothetical protein MLD38_018838 [Melastoma candidum]|uniref:Uncharacterized protein n=1 Tax=Melastoma candidum TaxID=119954 RepID=A0ACB9QWD3_9MYRT|nr:hypothetical protein MLD38_018838 [Melastoma candidum]